MVAQVGSELRRNGLGLHVVGHVRHQQEGLVDLGSSVRWRQVHLGLPGSSGCTADLIGTWAGVAAQLSSSAKQQPNASHPPSTGLVAGLIPSDQHRLLANAPLESGRATGRPTAPVLMWQLKVGHAASHRSIRDGQSWGRRRKSCDSNRVTHEVVRRGRSCTGATKATCSGEALSKHDGAVVRGRADWQTSTCSLALGSSNLSGPEWGVLDA